MLSGFNGINGKKNANIFGIANYIFSKIKRKDGGAITTKVARDG